MAVTPKKATSKAAKSKAAPSPKTQLKPALTAPPSPKKPGATHPRTNVKASVGSKHKQPRTTRSPEIIEAILERIAQGESLSRICDEPAMPTSSAFFDWLHVDAELRRRYAKATDARAERYAEEVVAISDETEVQAVYDGKNTVLELSATAVARNRLRVDARKWYASKIKPKKYGDKIEVSGNPEAPLVTATIPLPTDPAEAAKVYKEMVNAVSR